jgi:HAE1 family hydrophobic/amphiphilic exporter-1
MGTTVIGGMLAATAIGIFLIPAIFYVVEKLSGAAAHQDAERQHAAMPPPEPSPGQGG